jgi:hypothetical protein
MAVTEADTFSMLNEPAEILEFIDEKKPTG